MSVNSNWDPFLWKLHLIENILNGINGAVCMATISFSFFQQSTICTCKLLTEIDSESKRYILACPIFFEVTVLSIKIVVTMHTFCYSV